MVNISFRADSQREMDTFALDAGWLRPLGLLRGASLRGMSEAQRREQLAEHSARQPWILTGADNDPAGRTVNSLTSVAHYDEATGHFAYKLIYWRHIPGAGEDQRADSDQYVISLRGERVGEQGGVPEIEPTEIWFNGSLLFNGTLNGGPDSADRHENRRLFTRVLELAKRVNENLVAQKPIHELGGWLAGNAEDENFSAVGLGGKFAARSLDDKGWDPYERSMNEALLAALDKRPVSALHDENVVFEFPAASGHGTGEALAPIDRLKDALGFYRNSVELVRSLGSSVDEQAGDLQTGLSYLCSSHYEKDVEGRHRFTIRIEPQSVPDDQKPVEPIDLLALDFAEPQPGRFELMTASLMGHGPHASAKLAAKYDHIGVYQDVMRALSLRQFPPLNDIIAKHNLLHLINEMHVPPAFAETGGEMVWVSLFGTSMEKKVENYGDGIGGGNALVQRGRKANGEIDEIPVLHGVPYQPTTADSDYDGMQPDIMRWMPNLSRGIIILDHIHFDHSTIEFFASQIDADGEGWLKGQKILCKQEDAYIVKKRLRGLGVHPRHWPHFVEYDKPSELKANPDLFQIKKDHYAYRIRDEEGHTRFWIQICKDGSLHSAITDLYMITGCYDNKFQDTYLIPSDTVTFRPHGWDFIEQGQLGLVGLPGVDEAALRQTIGKDGMYIALEDPTNLTLSGHAPTFDQLLNDTRTIIGAVPLDHAAIITPFSTNNVDIRAALKICSEEKTLRNVTAVGKNMEDRLAAMNKFGVDPDIDWDAPVPRDLLPAEAFEAAYDGLEKFLAHERKEAAKLARKSEDGSTAEDILAQNTLYGEMAALKDAAQAEFAKGVRRPVCLYQTLFSCRGDDKPPIKEVSQALKAVLKDYRAGMPDSPFADTTAFMLDSLAQHGRVKFKTRNNFINATLMYWAVMAGQEKAAQRGVRSSKKAKNFRDNLGHLAVFATGPLGTVEDDMAMLSRFRRGDSLFDYDEVTRNSGYKIDPKHMTLLIMQTPSMGERAAIAQEALVHDIAYDRGVTVHLSTQNGIRTVNPANHRARYMAAFEAAGWNVVSSGARQDLYAPGRATHFRGHGFYQNMEDKLKDPRYKAKLVEFIHIPGWRAFERGKEICGRAGRRTSIKRPATHIARQAVDDADGRAAMKDVDVLREAFRLIKKRAKYGKQFGWMVDMLRVMLMKRRGGERTGPLHVRSDGTVAAQALEMPHNAWLKAASGMSSRRARMAPSVADTRVAGGEPKGMPTSALLAAHIRARAAARRKKRAGEAHHA